MVDSKPCKPKILPYLNNHIGLLKAKKKEKKDSGRIQEESAGLKKKKRVIFKKPIYACDNILNRLHLSVSLFTPYQERVSLRDSWSRKCHQWMVECCRKCHWLTAVTPTGTAGPRSCQELPWSWSSATKLLTSPASVLCLTWLGAVWTQSSSLIPGGRCQRGLMSLPREKALIYTVAIRQTRILRNSRLSKPW